MQEFRDDAAGAGSTASNSAGESPESWGPNPEKLRGSDVFPPLTKSTYERCEALRALADRDRRTSSSTMPFAAAESSNGGSPFGHRCSQSLDIHQAEAGVERARIVFHA